MNWLKSLFQRQSPYENQLVTALGHIEGDLYFAHRNGRIYRMRKDFLTNDVVMEAVCDIPWR